MKHYDEYETTTTTTTVVETFEEVEPYYRERSYSSYVPVYQKRKNPYKLLAIAGVVILLVVALASCGGYQPPGGGIWEGCKAVQC